MSSLRSINHRRRSQSASTSSSTHRRSPDSPWRAPTKRAYPAFNSGNADPSSGHKWDVESWRSKRRRRDASPSGTSSDDDCSANYFTRGPSGRISPSSRPPLASNSADFGLSPEKEPRLRHSMYNPTFTVDHGLHNETPSYTELSRIRSNAFWELRRSVAENGEGLVRRMRDYEQSRARSDAYSKVKDAQKRGRKRSSLLAVSRRTPTLRPDSESEDEAEDDIQIFTGELPEAFVLRNTRSTSRASLAPSLDSMDEDSVSRERCFSPASLYMSDTDPHPASPTNSIDNTQSFSPIQHSVVTPVLSQSASSASSSIVSLPLPPSSFNAPISTPSSLPASRSEKALAALSLAIANGAGSITEDYEALRALQPTQALDDGAVGEMWH